jgi:hypothetical protein
MNQTYINNDMWRYYIIADKWELVVPFGINQITRTVKLWDGTFVDREVLIETPDKFFWKDNDNIRYIPYNGDNSDDVRVPAGRGGHSMNLIGNPPYYILIFGGQARISEVKENTNVTVTLRASYNDLWSFSLYSKKWHEVYVNSDRNPSVREDAKMITVKIDRLAVMYGGFYGDELYNEMWYYNLFTNMWQENFNYILYDNITNSVIPPALKGHTFVASDSGLILYGGVNWHTADLITADSENERKSLFLSDCQTKLDDEGLTVDDIGTPAWDAAYASTGDDCFQSIEPFPQEERSISYNTNVYVFPIDECIDNCNNRGTCNFGRCTCEGLYFGANCEYIKCPNSLCFVDIDTIDIQECYHCSGHGTCRADGVCICDENYTGED